MTSLSVLSALDAQSMEGNVGLSLVISQGGCVHVDFLREVGLKEKNSILLFVCVFYFQWEMKISILSIF